MSFDTAACTAWLGAKVTIINAEVALPTRLVTLLVDAFDAGLFDENDVPGSADVLGAEDIKARLLIWSAVIDDACKQATPAVPCGKRLDRLELGGDGAPKAGTKCWICQSDGHLAANCTTAKGKELRDKKVATAAAKAAAEAK
jgi:hypothetical protein